MSDWSPDSESSPDQHDATVARVMTVSPLMLRLVPTPHPNQPEGQIVFRALGAVDGEVQDDSPVLAQGALPHGLFEAVQKTGLFATPVSLMLSVQDDDGGIRGVLAAIVKQSDVQRAERESRSEDEPWMASFDGASRAPDFSGEDDAEETVFVPFVLGVILRFPEDRKFPESLDDEALDLMATLLSGQAMDADRKRVENLLKSL